MRLPLFPLHVVLFPGRCLPLHIFEPRYRRLLRDCLDGDRRFGVVAIRAGREVADQPEVFPVGTVAHIESVEHLPDGRANLVSRGAERFRLLHMIDGAPYPQGEVQLLAEPAAGPQAEGLAGALREILAPYLACLGAPGELLARLPREPSALAYLAASAIQVDVSEQQRLLELDEACERLAAVLAVLRREAAFIRHFGRVGSLRPAGPGGPQLN